MSKALEGGVLLGVAGGLLAAATGGLGAGVEAALMGSSFFAAHGVALMATLALTGTSMEAGAIAEALNSNRGSNITLRQPAAYRQVILGTQRVGGNIVYASTTGDKHDHYHRVIVLAGHVCHSILNLYLDGRRVYWGGHGDGYQTRNGVTFGGWCDSNDHIGPDGSTYNFNGNLVYCEARYGDQPSGDVMRSLTTNDPKWAASAAGSPYLGGCTYIYLQISDDAGMFPSDPEIRLDINGKSDIYDPRTDSTGFTTNPTLLIADRMTDPVFGLGMNRSEINTAQWIAAANVCDELVPLANGGSEVRYAASWHGDTSTGPGDVISTLMTSCAGRLSRIGGEWFIWPAYWQGPSLNFDKSVLLGVPKWEPKRSLAERYNRVTGTYTAPNYPFNAAGNVYDANGWYDGTTENTFQFGFQPTNYPQYAQDPAHGYTKDEWLEEDGGYPLPKELSQPCTLSVSQAQRVAKITLMRSRYEGLGTLTCNLGVFGVQPTDVMLMTFPEYLGWNSKILEVSGFDFHIEERGGGSSSSRALAVWCELEVNETSPDVYAWDPSEEQTVYAVPAGLQQTPYVVPAPTAVSLSTTSSTGNNPGVGGNSTNYAIKVAWTAPADVLVTSIEVQAKQHSASTWLDASVASAASTTALIYGVNSGDKWDVRIRSLRSNGATSTWAEVDSYTV